MRQFSVSNRRKRIWIYADDKRDRESLGLERNYTGDEQYVDVIVVGVVGVSGSSLKYDM